MKQQKQSLLDSNQHKRLLNWQPLFFEEKFCALLMMMMTVRTMNMAMGYFIVAGLANIHYFNSKV
jgi:hypothetical protein